jgi:hypothetical protein
MKTKSIFLALIAIFISLASMSQSAGAGSGSGAGNGSAGTTGSGRSTSTKTGTHRTGKGKRHSTNRSAASATANNRTSSINTPQSGLSNTGGSYNTMPDNNDSGKETTSDKGKDGPTNGVVKAGRVSSSGGIGKARKK